MSLFPSPAELERARSIAFRGLVRFHASELLESHHFLRRGRISTGQVHAIAKDLDKLDRVRGDDWIFGVSAKAADGSESPIASAVPGGAFLPLAAGKTQ